MNNNDRLALGTVQLGLPYGIANVDGQPSEETALSILHAAWQMGIRSFDTASAYGKSEFILGKWDIRDERLQIISKFSDTDDGLPIEEKLEKGLAESLKRMERSALYGYLLHDATKAGEKDWMQGLKKLKTSGMVAFVGISIYTPEQALLSVESKDIDIIQIPYSFLDQRLDEGDFFKKASENHKEIWARSAFVQGLLFLDDAKVPNDLQQILPIRKQALAIGLSYGYTLQKLAILFSLGNPHIQKVLIGIDSVRQLQEYDGIVNELETFSKCRSALVEMFRGKVDPYLISPNKWRKQ